LYLTGDLWPIPEVSCTCHPIFALGCILINIFPEVFEPCRHLKRKKSIQYCHYNVSDKKIISKLPGLTCLVFMMTSAVFQSQFCNQMNVRPLDHLLTEWHLSDSIFLTHTHVTCTRVQCCYLLQPIVTQLVRLKKLILIGSR